MVATYGCGHKTCDGLAVASPRAMWSIFSWRGLALLLLLKSDPTLLKSSFFAVKLRCNSTEFKLLPEGRSSYLYFRPASGVGLLVFRSGEGGNGGRVWGYMGVPIVSYYAPTYLFLETAKGGTAVCGGAVWGGYQLYHITSLVLY